MKRIISALICVLLLFSVFGCSNDAQGTPDTSDTSNVVDGGTDSESSTPDTSDTSNGSTDKGKDETQKKPDDVGEIFDWNDGDPPKTKYTLNSNTEGIKILGVRNYESTNSITCDWSCSGIELTVNLEGGAIEVSITHSSGSSYFKVYVDGAELKNGDSPYYNVTGNGKIYLNDISSGEHTIAIVKATGYTRSRAEITDISFAGSIVTSKKPADKQLYIEYVGDSISAGWGTIGAYDGAYTSMDGTLAYPWLVSKALNADYSIMAMSGNGIRSGAFPRNYLYSSYSRDSSEVGKYGFERKADLVVVNIGTNDIDMPAADFRSGYLKLLQDIKANNGDDCKILCIYGVMNHTHSEQILSVCTEMGGTEADIYSLELDKTAGVYTGHPTAEENAKYTEIITEYIRNTVLADTTA